MCHGIPADRARRSATMHDRRAENSKACAILQGPKSAGSAPHPQSTVNDGPNVPVHGGRIRSFPATQPCRHLQRSEEHTSDLQSLMRISYAVFCLKKTNI